MEYQDNKTKWDQVFPTEFESLQQKMSSFDVESLSKSTLHLCLENKILDWNKYESWAIQTYGCCSLKENISATLLKNFATEAKKVFDQYLTYKFWNQELMPVALWNNQLIVLGLQYNSSLEKIPNHIFILAHPKILNFFNEHLFNKRSSSSDFSELEKMFENQSPGQENLAPTQAPLNLDFKSLSTETVTNFVNKPRLEEISSTSGKELQIWDLINERHAECVYESRKQYEAFIVLKIIYDTTHIFKMDPELEKTSINDKLFDYNLKQNNVFRQVSTSKKSQTVETSQLGLNIIGFNFATISPIQQLGTVVGFFVAFKKIKPSLDDQKIIENLALDFNQDKAS